MKPGIYYDMLISEYLAQKGIRSGDICAAADALSVYKHRRDHPDETGEWAGFGQALHYRVLEPEKYKFTVAVAPDCDRRTKAGKEVWDNFTSQNAGKIILKADEAEQIEGMYKSVIASDTARKLLDGIKTEVSVFWNDQGTGQLCQARLDGWKERLKTIIELKGVRCASPWSFLSQVCDIGWDRQAAHQATGMKANGFDVAHHVYIAVEKEPPHLLTVVELDPEQMAVVEQSNIAVIKRIHVAVQLDQYPGYPDMVQVMRLPDYRIKNLENTL